MPDPLGRGGGAAGAGPAAGLAAGLAGGAAPPVARRAVIAGYYGLGNVGDEAILRALLRDLGREVPGIECLVLTAGGRRPPGDPRGSGPDDLERGGPGQGGPGQGGARASYLSRLDPAAIHRAMRRSDVFVLGGGTLIQDVTSLRSLYYYLGLIWLAKRLGLKAAICGGGIGPLRTALGRRAAARVLGRVDLLALRDRLSVAVAQELGVPAGRILLTADPAFGLGEGQGGAAAASVEAILERSAVPVEARQRLLGVSLRPPLSAADLGVLAGALREASARLGLFPLLLSLHPEQDRPLLERLGRESGVPCALLAGNEDPEVLRLVVARLRLAVAMRLHGVIFAVSAGVPCVALSYDPKVDALAEDVPDLAYATYPGLDAAELLRTVERLLAERETLRPGLLASARTLAARARGNARAVAELL